MRASPKDTHGDSADWGLLFFDEEFLQIGIATPLKLLRN
jgi:hypothetical protein